MAESLPLENDTLNLKVRSDQIVYSQANDKSSIARDVNLFEQSARLPTHIKDIKVSKLELRSHGTVTLSNKLMLITDGQNKLLKLISTQNGDTITEIHLSGKPYALTKFNANEIAVTLNNPNTIQLFTISNDSLAHKRDIPVDTECRGIAYNENEKTLIVSFCNPAKVEMMSLSGNVLKTIKIDSTGEDLFSKPHWVATTNDSNGVYVSDYGVLNKSTVTLLKLNGDTEAVYMDEKLSSPAGIIVHKSGLVYVVGYFSNTVHHLDPESGKFKLLLDQKDGLSHPWSISYCDVEDRMYVGMYNDNFLKVYQMK